MCQCVQVMKPYLYSSYSWSYHLVKLMIMALQDPSVFCKVQTGGITAPASFTSLVMALISAFPPGMQYHVGLLFS